MRQVYFCGNNYISLVESFFTSSKEQSTIKTTDGRFFMVSKNVMDSVALIEDGRFDFSAPGASEKFKKLIHAGIYIDILTSSPYSKRKPKLSKHFGLIPRELVNRICDRLGFLFVFPFFWWSLVALIICNFSICLICADYYVESILRPELTMAFLIFFLSGFISSLIHEFGHSSSCKSLSGSTGEIGAGINFIFPAFYANVSDVYMLDKEGRVAVALSGVYLQLVFCAFLIPWSFSSSIVSTVLMANWISILLSLIPFIRNDGYWALCDYLETPSLLMDTIKSWKDGSVSFIHIVYSVLLMGLFAWVVLSMYTFINFIWGMV